MNIFRDQIRKTKIRNGFRFQLGRKESDVSLASCLCLHRLQLGADRKLSTCAAICRLRRVAPGHLRLALPDPSIGRWSDLHAIGHREGSVSYVEESSWAGHGWRRQGLFREGPREVEGHWVWATGTKRKFDSARRCNSCANNRVSNRNAAEGALLEQARSRQTPQEVLILCLGT